MSIQAHHLTLARGSKVMLSDFSMTLSPGEFVAVLGANGAGKSSLLSALAGELRPQGGHVSLDGVAMEKLDALGQAQRRAVLPQQPSLAFAFSVMEVVLMGAYPFAQARPAEVAQWVEHATALMSLGALTSKPYTALSGGEQQRVQLARVLVQCYAIEAAHGSAYLLLDEPLTSLDPKHQLSCMRALAQLTQKGQVGVVVVLHDLNMAAQFCDKLILLAQGRLVAQGAPAVVLTADVLEQAYDLPMTVVSHPLEAGRLLVLH